MPPNLRKSQPNLAKPSDSGTFNAARKPSESTSPLTGLNISAQQELGTIGGIKATGRLTVGVDNLIGQQGLNIEIDATNRTAGFGAGIGSTKGKLGVNSGGRVGYDENGNVKIKGAEAGINIGGFGGSASIDEDEGIRGSISVAGAKVEVGIAPDGKKTVSLCYGVPGGELCVTFEPDPGIEAPSPSPSPTPTPTPVLAAGCVSSGGILYGAPSRSISGLWQGLNPDGSIRKQIQHEYIYTHVVGNLFLRRYNYTTFTATDSQTSGGGTIEVYLNLWRARPDDSRFTQEIPDPMFPGYFNGGYAIGGDFGGQENQVICLSRPGTPPPTPTPPIPPTNKIQLPNYPQHIKPMNCCDKVEEIYKYLGIAKLKKNKFPVSNAFLVPGGSGNNDCIDYYAIAQALFRMLANGLIINPKSKPLGTEWQNVNATAWASNMYEMMAESMSDGNSSQRFEVAAIMQLVQMTSILAETARKIEFVADAIGLEPLPVPEEVPVCFTIYEGHKGFGKKEPQKLKISGLKTDEQVENVLGKMLNPSLIPITAWKFKPGQISINEALRNG